MEPAMIILSTLYRHTWLRPTLGRPGSGVWIPRTPGVLTFRCPNQNLFGPRTIRDRRRLEGFSVCKLTSQGVKVSHEGRFEGLCHMCYPFNFTRQDRWYLYVQFIYSEIDSEFVCTSCSQIKFWLETSFFLKCFVFLPLPYLDKRT